MRIWLLIALVGCATERIELPTDGDPCVLAEETAICPECLSGNVTCRYEDVSVTEASCRSCQAENVLYQTLCDEGAGPINGTITCSGPPGSL